MEFIAGESLADWLRTRGALPPALAMGFASQIARGLGAIHEQNIVHRDLKPANLMIVPAGRTKSREGSETNPDAWQIKIIDFGLARGFAGSGLGTEADAQTIGFRGTALYASPEQCEERGQIDGRSDLYALGCILWEMLLGTTPFRARTHRELLNQHVSLAPPLERIAFLPAGLRSVVTRLLAKDPSDRFADAEAVVKALDRCAAVPARGAEQPEDVGVTTREVDAVERPSMWREHRAWHRACAAGAAMILAGAGWFFLRENKPRSPAPSLRPHGAGGRGGDASGGRNAVGPARDHPGGDLAQVDRRAAV